MRILLRIIVAFACWLVGTLLGFFLSLALAGWPSAGSYGPGYTIILPLAAIYGFPIWAGTFVPLFFALKDTHLLWKPPLAALIGAAAGLLGSLILLGGHFSDLTKGASDDRALACMPLLIGMFTFALGAIFKQHYFYRFAQLVKTTARQIDTRPD